MLPHTAPYTRIQKNENMPTFFISLNRTVDETLSGKEVLTFVQKDMSDQYYGPGVDELRNKLRELKGSIQ